jgi:hypothetical protein
MIDHSLLDELTENDLSPTLGAQASETGGPVGMANLAKSEIYGAVNQIGDKRKDNIKEGRRKKFIYISLSIFLICLIPNLAFMAYKSSRGSSNFYASWQKQNSEASLASGSTGGSKVVGAEAQKPIKITNRPELFQKAELNKYRDQLQLRVQQLIDQSMEMEIKRLKTADATIPENTFMDWLIGWPDKMLVESLELSITNNDYVFCELVVTGQPLHYAIEADFYITNVDGYKWKKASDNAPFGEKRNTLLRQTLVKDMVIKMQK